MSEWYKVMTWGEFKAYVDEELAKQGHGDDTKIGYIDIRNPKHRHPGNPNEMDVPEVAARDGGMSIQ